MYFVLEFGIEAPSGQVKLAVAEVSYSAALRAATTIRRIS